MFRIYDKGKLFRRAYFHFPWLMEGGGREGFHILFELFLLYLKKEKENLWLAVPSSCLGIV